MNFDASKSLQELKGKKMESPENETSLTLSVYRLWATPLNSYSVEDLRLMIGQGIELEYLMPLAIEKLTANPLIEGDFYLGDLLFNVLSVECSFWQKHIKLYYEVSELIAGLPNILKKLIEAIEKFERIKI
jgi:hypothetical protein